MRIRQRLEADAHGAHALSEASRHERDRALGRRLEAGSAADLPPLARVAAWCREQGDGATPGSTMSTVCTIGAGLGLLAGIITGSGAFFFEGSGRVNVLVLLALFVVLPLATLTLFLLAATTRRRPRGLDPGRLAALAGRWLRGDDARALADLAAGAAGPQVARWLLMTWSQWMALGFGLGATAAALALVLFTDLAFGWSTTLDVDADTIHGAMATLALPWSAWLPEALPSSELVTLSRFFRLSADQPVLDPQQLGAWWPFVVMAMLVYAVAPRVLTVPLSHWRLAHACAEALLDDAEVCALLERMSTPRVETRSTETEQRRGAAPEGLRFTRLPDAARWQLINWASLPLDERSLAPVLAPARLLGVHPAGGARSTAQDRALAEHLATASPTAGVLVIARSFDPPTLDLTDFLEALRAALPETTPVAIAPVAVSDGAPAAPRSDHAATWARALARLQLRGVQPVTIADGEPP